MRSFFSGDGYRLRFGPVHVRIVLSPKAFLVTAAILSALALTPNFKRVKAPETAELPLHAAARDVPGRMPPSPLSVKSPGGAPGINDLLYLEDFGSNLYTIDSMTGAASLAPSESAGAYAPAVAGTVNSHGPPPNNPPVAWGALPALPRVSPAGVPVRSSGRGVRSAEPSGGAGSAGASSGSAAPARAASPDSSAGPSAPVSGPPVTDEGNRGNPDVYKPNPARFGILDWYSSSGTSGPSGHELPPVFRTHNLQPSGTSGAEPSGSPPPDAEAPLFTATELFGYSTVLSVTAFSSTELADSQGYSDNLAQEIAQSLQARVSFASASPVPEPRGTLLFSILLILIARSSGRHPSVRRYNTGQKRARCVSEAQPMLKTLTLFTALLTIPAFAPSAFAQKDLPEGAGKTATVRVCTGCHGAEMFSATRLGQAEWDRMVANMTTERGFAITDADYATVLKYLTTYLAPPKANLSKAPDVK